MFIMVCVLALFLAMIVTVFVPNGAANQPNCPTGFTGTTSVTVGTNLGASINESSKNPFFFSQTLLRATAFTGISGFTGLTGPDTGCSFFLVCYTGPTGPAGSAIPITGATGFDGSTGARGYDILNNSYGPLDEAFIASIEAQSSPYRYMVTIDERSNMNLPPPLAGDMTWRMIFWTGSVWQNLGQFQGYPGDTGATGASGATGFAGAPGASIGGGTGATGPMGATGANGTNGWIQAGSRFGDALSLSYPGNFLSYQNTNIPNGTTITLTSDAYFDSLTTQVTSIIRTNGWRIFVRGTLNHNGLIDNSGGDGLDANDGPPTNYKGGTGAAAGSMFGGGIGGYSYLQGVVPGGDSPNALAAPPFFDGGGPSGLVTANNSAINTLVMNSLVNTISGFELLGLIKISGGAGGGCFSYNADSIIKGGGGGGGGVIFVTAQTFVGFGTVRAVGGNSGVNSFAGPPSGAGGGGLILMATVRNIASYALQVKGGTCFDITQPGGVNPAFDGQSGLAYFM